MDERRLALIRYVSSHYGELQGLTSMGVFAVMGAAAAWTLLFGFHWGVPVVAIGLAAAGGLAATRFYSKRFGRVRGRAADTWIQRWPSLWGALGAAAIFWDQQHFGAGIPSILCLLSSVPVLWRVISGWPFQTHRLVVFVAMLLASMLFAVVDSEARMEEWLATSLCLISIGWFVAGWFDHRLLVRALGEGPHDTPQEETHGVVVR